MDLLINLIVSLSFGAGCAYLAQTKQRNSAIWFTLGILFTFISLIILYFLPPSPSQNPQTIERPPNPPEQEAENTPTIQAPQAQTEESEWFYLDKNRQQQGPVELTKLQTLWTNQGIDNQTLVWRDGMSEWRSIETTNELKNKIDS